MAQAPIRRSPRRRTPSPQPAHTEHTTPDDTRPQTPVLALPPERAAQALNIPRSAVYRLIAQARQGDPDGLPSIKIGKRRLVPVSALETFIARRLEAAS